MVSGVNGEIDYSELLDDLAMEDLVRLDFLNELLKFINIQTK